MISDCGDVRNTESRAVEILFVLIFVVVRKLHVVFNGCGKWLTQYILYIYICIHIYICVAVCVTCKPAERNFDKLCVT